MDKITNILYPLIMIGFGYISVSCQPTRRTRDSFRLSIYCYNGGYTGIDTLIEIEGYYKFEQSFIRNVGFPSVPTPDTLVFTALFKNDGIFVYNFNPEYFESTSNARFGFYNRGTKWGRYYMSGDTIKAQFVESPGGMSWEKGQFWFQIVNQSTIRELNFQYRESITPHDVLMYQQSEKGKNTSLGHFTKYNNLPDADQSWLKKRKWFWCDKNEYLKWKRTSHNSN
jgi:hypothetical protein